MLTRVVVTIDSSFSCIAIWAMIYDRCNSSSNDPSLASSCLLIERWLEFLQDRLNLAHERPWAHEACHYVSAEIWSFEMIPQR